ncbi:MAG TPA: adenosylcobinamide amidohydrolase [Acidimicrobiales bacterium]|jgi:adenosylcobinamide amidohydrolase|nr:adenosylcobinamide amidohydrolase [Acidimicrobiales bacterium]
MISELRTVTESGGSLPVLVWNLAVPMMAASTAPSGGGLGLRHWVLNAQVADDYGRCDPEDHVAGLALGLGLSGPGVGMLTAADVTGARQAADSRAEVEVTVGISLPTWAAAPGETPGRKEAPLGTINVVAFLPERLSDAALLNALCTVTEAKAQALFDAGVKGTGTASDAVAILCLAAGPPHRFGGPRSTWGSRLARAVHAAVLDGCTQGAR